MFLWYSLPEGKDPADMILENAELWKQYVSDKKGYLEFHNISTEHESLRDRIGAVEKNIFPILVRVSNNVKRDVYLQSVAETLHVSSDSIRKEFQKFLQNYQKDTTGFNYQSSSIATKVVSVHNPLTVQIHELAAIRESFSLETNFWFINNPESLELLKKESISVPTDIQAEILVRYQSLDNAAWKIRLDTLWIRIQQILLDTKMDELRQVIKSSSENEVIQKLQIELMTLHAQKESLIRSLAE
jgi:DNA primase